MKILFTNLLLFVGHFWIQSQHLTISNSGQTGTSGTNWSITGNTLNIASSGSAHINTSVITNHLTNIGDLTIVLPHNGVNSRDLYLNNSITYTGSSARTLTFNITNDIIFASNMGISSSNASLNLVFRTALTLTNIDHGRIALNQSTLNTNGGHLWMGGGPTTATWNGLTVGNSMARVWADNLAGISIINSTIITNGGHIYMYGRSHNTSDDFGSSNFGVNIENSSISSTSGSITIGGDVLGRFTNGVGTTINSYTSATTISTTSGSINILGVGSDAATNGNGWRLGTSISGSSSTVKTTISSVSGNIQIEGNANFAATVNDKEGIVIGGSTEIISRSGNISLKGTNALETSGQYCNSIRFAASNVSNSIRVGFDGTNSYTGNILIEGNSIYQRDQHAGSGSISIQTTGNLTIQPTGNAFTFMRAGNSGTLTFDNDWNFGTNLGGFVYGKTTNTSALTYNNSLRTNGPMTFYTGSTQLGVGVEMTADGANGHINFLSSNGFGTVANSGSTRGKIMATGGGSINVNADYDNNNSGILDIDWLTIDGTSGNVLFETATFSWNTGSQVALPEFYSNGGALTIRNTTSSNHDISTNWFAMFGTFGGVTLGREGGTGAIALVSCTSCHSSALNFGTSAFQIAGPITVLGAIINANINLRSTNSGSDILLKADKHIVVGANVGVQSNNGDITFWSNSNGVADATDGDFIGIQNAVVINSADGSTTQTTGGGTITMAGGTTTQTLASGTIVPTGYAYSNRTTNWGPLLPPGGVNFGFSTAANGQVNSLSIYSGGGNIVIKGKSHSSSAGIQWFSGSAGATQIINSGVGTILFDGLATSTNAHGIEFMSYASVVSPTIISSNTSSEAIRIIGETFSTNLRSGYQGTVRLEAKGIGGGIEVNGKVGSSSNYAAIEAGTLNAYALSGPITFISEGGLGLKAGGVWGKGTLASSSSNITLRSDNISLYTATIETTGTLTVEPLGTSFASALTFPITNLTVGNTVSGLTLGKSTNTANITLANATTIAGPITAYGGDIAVNENLNTSAGASAGSVLLKGSGDVTLAATKSITTSGAPVILWANSDNGLTNGSIALRNASSIITGSNTVAGGHVWIGGGSNGITWNGLAVGSGYAVPGTSFTPSNGGGALSSAGIYLERNSITSFGGNIKIAGDAAASGYVAIATYGNTITINAGSGKIEMEGQVTSSAAGNRMGVLFGFHDNTVISTVNISSSSTSGDAIKITGVGRGTEDAIGLSGTLNIIASGGGNIVMNGNAMGTGRSIVAGNYYHGIMNVLANSGNITLNGNTKAVQVATPVIGGLTSGPSKINIGQGGTITSSSSDVFLTADNIALAAGGIGLISTGKVTIEPFSNSFTNALTFPITSLSLANTVSGLTIGKSTNTQNITFGGATTIAGPITAYGGNMFLNDNLTTTGTGSDILIKGTSNINLATSKTITTAAGDVSLWADSDDNATGYVQLLANAAISSNGGDINLGGGADLTSDYAFGTTAETCPEVVGTQYISGVHMRQGSSLTSNGGNISVRGQNANTSASAMSFGISLRGVLMNSGTGKINLNGVATGTSAVNAQGIASWGTLTLRSANTSSDAISISGNAFTSSGAGSSLGINLVALFEATGNGGGIVLNGKSGSAPTNASVNIAGDILAVSGPISLSGENSSGNYNNIFIGTTVFGKKSGTNVTSSSSNIILEGNVITAHAPVSIDCSGTLTVRPFGNSFTSALTWPMSNVSLGSSISGLTLGKSTNTANVTFGATTNIAGPITAFGGAIAVNENISSSNGSTISLFGNELTFGTGKTVTSNNGLLIIAPQSASNTIGLGGATGTLSLPASYFSTNFSDGFSNIQIGSNTQTGNISANAFTLRDNITVLTTGSLNLGGKPILGSNNVTLGSAISSISGTPTHYFQTNGTGTVKRSIGNNANLLFPIGNASYNPITITNKTGTADTFSINILDTAYLNGSSSGNITSPYVKRTWNISKNTPTANAGSGVDFTFNWNANEVVGTLTNPTLNHHNGTGWNIPTMGTTSVSGNSLTYTGYKGSFSPFAIGGSNVGALPIELKSFNTECQSDYVQVDWTTASEKNNKMFELYKSDNAIDWNLIHTTDGQGDKASETNYQFIDNDKKPAYYRLKDIDFDGIENWSQIIFADCKNESTQIEVYPNPATEFIKVIVPYEENTTLNILSMEGKILKTLPLVSKNNLINVKDLTVGIYLMELSSKTLNKRIRFVKN
jgi:hypothetical protein